MEKTIDLGAMVDEFAGRAPEPAIPTRVAFFWELIKETKRANIALQNMGDDQRIEFLDRFLFHWRRAVINGSDGEKALVELHNIFGESHDIWFGQRLMFTLTADGLQLRCWYGKPGCLSPKHVDSCGRECLFSIHASAKMIQKYIDGLFSIEYQMKAIKLPNGVTIFGLDWKEY